MLLALAMLWMLGPLLMALFGKAVETLEGWGLAERSRLVG